MPVHRQITLLGRAEMPPRRPARRVDPLQRPTRRLARGLSARGRPGPHVIGGGDGCLQQLWTNGGGGGAL